MKSFLRHLRWRFRLLHGPLKGYVPLLDIGRRFSDDLWEVPDVSILFDYGVVATRDRRLVAEFSPDISGHPENHPAFRLQRLPTHSTAARRVLLASGHAHQVYYHWMFDILPRIAAGLSRLEECDTVATNTDFPYQRETLAILGIPIEKLFPVTTDTHIQAATLLGSPCRMPYGTPTAQTCAFLRSLVPAALTDTPLPFRNLYLARGPSALRPMLNEAEVCAALLRRGFEIVNCASLSVKEQARRFAEARLIVAPHGSAMTNIVFCRPGTTVIELIPSTCEATCFQRISECIGLRFHRLECLAEPGPAAHSFRSRPVDLLRFLDTLPLPT
ncbi:MAG: glycosyltransferase family 61 protein [Opitutaceae bacterium]|nr:glycosyltransferase family 61 protein [Opitutaceae bacterium]